MIGTGNSSKLNQAGGKLQFLILAFIIVNTIILVTGFIYALERMTGGDSLLDNRLELARDLGEYNRRLAIDLGVSHLDPVREALAEYNYQVDLAVSSDELIQITFNQGRIVQEVIFKEAEAGLKERVLVALNNDVRVRETQEKTHLFIRFGSEKVNISPEHLLETNTVLHIRNLYSPNPYYKYQNLDIEIVNGKATYLLPQTYEDQMRILNEDLSTIYARLHEIRVQAGHAEMVGPGITLLVYDAGEHSGSDSLVHDADVRDLVNELFSSGARGISVGEQRLTATSSIRCSGPLIMVNYRQIPTNPVTIQAVGDPDLLTSGLNIIMNELERARGLSFEISTSGFLKLPASNNSN